MLKVKVISLPYIFQVLYVLCFTRPRYQVSVYWTIGPLVILDIDDCASNPCQNKATCTDLVDGYRCQCLPGYTGKQCKDSE